MKKTSSPEILIFNRTIYSVARGACDIWITFAFFISIILAFHISIGPVSISVATSKGIIIASWVLCVSLNHSNLLRRDVDSGLIEQLLFIGVLPEIIILLRYLAVALCYVLMAVPSALIACLMFNLKDILGMGANLILLTLISLLLSLLSESLTLKTTNNIATTLIITPFLIPALVFAMLNNATYYSQALYLLAEFCFLLPICIFASTYFTLICIKE